MAQSQVNVGTNPNDGTGDTLRAAFQTQNSNATDAETRLAALEGATTSGYHTATATPSDSGTVTLNTSANRIRYIKDDKLVHIQGRLLVDSVSSPVGAYIEISIPFAIATLTGSSGRFGGAVQYDDSGASSSLERFVGIETQTVFRIFRDASTWAANDEVYFTFSYETT